MKEVHSYGFGARAASVRLADRNPIGGTAGDDTLSGTGGDDVIDGLAGDDTIYGGDGDDILRGGNDRDKLYGGDGDDWLDGGGHDDLLDGGEGSDTADYSATSNAVVVNLGTIFSYSGSTGSASFPGTNWPQETLVSIENVVTGRGDDTLTGNQADNTLDGGAGNDRFIATSGRDTYIGGAGTDTLEISAWDFADIANFSQDGLIYASVAFYGALGVGIDLSKDRDNIIFIGLPEGNPQDGVASTAVGIENIEAGVGHDTLIGNGAANRLSGGNGDDVLHGGGGADWLFGGDGNDLLVGGGDTDRLDGGDGLDIADYTENTTAIRATLQKGKVEFLGQTWNPEQLQSIEGIHTGSGNDILKGTGDDNILRSGDGNDKIKAFGGDDILDGGLGRDSLNGGGGSDTVSYENLTQNVMIDLGNNKATNLSGPVIKHTLSSIENATGGHGHDRIIGDRGANILDGGAGNDVLVGKKGNDTFLLSEGSDTLKGGSGSDTVFFDIGDAATLSALFDYMDFQTPRYSDVTASVRMTDGWAIDMDLSRGTLEHSMGDGGSARLVSIENIRLVNGFGDDRVIGSAADNEIWVGGGANWVDAGAGDDTIYGGGWGSSPLQPVRPDDLWMPREIWKVDLPSSAEVLRGGAGDDIIFGAGTMLGGTGDDSLTSTAWQSEVVMVGGAGADNFVFSLGMVQIDSYFGNTAPMIGVISDFDAAEGDRMVLNGARSDLPNFIGEVGPFDDVASARIGDGNLGYWRSGADTMILYDSKANTDVFDLAGLTIRLEDYAGPVTEDMFIMA